MDTICRRSCVFYLFFKPITHQPKVLKWLAVFDNITFAALQKYFLFLGGHGVEWFLKSNGFGDASVPFNAKDIHY